MPTALDSTTTNEVTSIEITTDANTPTISSSNILVLVNVNLFLKIRLEDYDHYSLLICFLHELVVPREACCLEKGVPRICLGICMNDCTETPDEIYRLVNSDNVCNKHEPTAKECCEKEKGK